MASTLEALSVSEPKPLPAGRPGAKVGGIAARFAAAGSACVTILSTEK